MDPPPNPTNVPFNRRLIPLVYERPALWDRMEMVRIGKSQREQLWEQIGQILNAPATVCRNRWNVLRGTYHTNIRLQSRGKKRGLDWEYREDLAFLQKGIDLRTASEIMNISEKTTQPKRRSTVASQALNQAMSGSSAPQPPNAPLLILLNPPSEAQNAQIPGRLTSLNRERPGETLRSQAEKLSPQASFLLSFEKMLCKAGPQKEMQLRTAITNLFLEHFQEEERLEHSAGQHVNF